MPYGQAGFSGPPSPGNVSTVGSMAKDAEHVQRTSSPRPQSSCAESVEGTEARDQGTHEAQVQQEQEEQLRHPSGTLLLRTCVPQSNSCKLVLCQLCAWNTQERLL